MEDIPIKRFEILFDSLNLMKVDFNQLNKMFQEEFSKTIYPLEESHEVIEYLFSKNIPIYIATNGLNRLQIPRIINTSFGKYLTKIITSEEAGENKPNSKIFDIILRDANIESNKVS